MPVRSHLLIFLMTLSGKVLTMRFHRSYIVFIGLAALAAAPAQAQGLNGQPVDVSLVAGGTTGANSSVFSDLGTQTVTPAGVTFNDTITHFSIAVTPSQIQFTETASGISSIMGGGGSFFGYAASEKNAFSATITGFYIDPATTASGFNLSRVSGDPTHIFVNLNGLTFRNNDFIRLNIITAAPVPEASTTASFGLLLALGLGGLAVAGRRKKANVKAAV